MRDLFFAAVLLVGCTQQSAVAPLAEPLLATTQINGNNLPPKTVVLTYDDGPDDHTLELAHYLADQGVHVTFFENGRRYCKELDAQGNCTTPQDTRPCDDGMSQAPVAMPKHYPEWWMDEILSLGHRIANHTQDHCHLMAETNMADIVWEVQTTQTILERHVCDGVFMLRAPYGEWDSGDVSRINSAMPLHKLIGPVNWDVDGNDWDCWQKGTTPEACAQGYLDLLNARPNKNGIFLMHDRPEFNVTYAGPLLMAKIIIPKLKAAGFKFATMDDVLKLPPHDGGVACMPPPDPDGGTGVATDAGASAGDDASAATGGSGGSGGTSGSGAGGSGGGVGGSGGASGSGAGGSGGASGSGMSGSGGTGGKGGASGSSGASGSGDNSGGDDTGGTGGSTKAHGSNGGCAVNGARASSPAPLLILAALLIRRRRGH